MPTRFFLRDDKDDEVPLRLEIGGPVIGIGKVSEDEMGLRFEGIVPLAYTQYVVDSQLKGISFGRPQSGSRVWSRRERLRWWFRMRWYSVREWAARLILPDYPWEDD